MSSGSRPSAEHPRKAFDKSELARGLALALVYSVPLVVAWGAFTDRLWPFRAVIWVFFLLLLLDELVGRGPLESDDSERRPSRGPLARYGLWPWAPAHALMIVGGLWAVSRGEFFSVPPTWIGFVVAVSVGAAGGMLGIPIAHELMHSPSRFERRLAEAIMLLVSYPHFCIEHVRGHHRHVGTPRDPATARLGESFYAFYFRTLTGSLCSAWRLEVERLGRSGKSPWSAGNRLLLQAALLAAIYGLVGYLFGSRATVVFLAQGVIAFSILETLNYVEHYGLQRRRVASGQFERIGPHHSWDSRYRVTNWFMFNLARHADHHVQAGKRYTELRQLAQAPQLPAGYFALFVLALFPPAWRRVMDRRVERWAEETRWSMNKAVEEAIQ